MRSAVESKSDLAKCHSAPLMKRSSASGFHIYLIGIIIVGVMSVAVFQLFG